MKRNWEGPDQQSFDNVIANAYASIQASSQAAAENHMSNNQSFHSLLSTQRELLNQIRRENALQPEQTRHNRSIVTEGDLFHPNPINVAPNKPIQAGHDRYTLHDVDLIQPDPIVMAENNTMQSIHSSSRYRNIDCDIFQPNPISIPENKPIQPRHNRCSILDHGNLQPDPISVAENKPIFARRSVLDDKISPNRLNTGVASDIQFRPDTSSDCKSSSGSSSESSYQELEDKKKSPLTSDNEVSPQRLLESEQFQRLLHHASTHASTNVVSHRTEPQHNKVNSSSSRLNSSLAAKRSSSSGPNNEVLKAMVSFSNAMERSQKSQQDIHDWDKKMGLKRSHSKTMRLCSRSRKKLLVATRKQINKLSSKKRKR